MKTTLPWLAAAFILTGAAVSLRADTTNAPATSLDREKIHEQLKSMTPEVRRAKIEALRKESTAQPVNLPANIPPPPAPPPDVGPESRFIPFLEFVLTEDQRVSLRAAMAAQRDKTRELEGKLQDARKAAMAASLMEKFDEDTVRAKAVEVGRLDAELVVLRAKALAQMKPPLSAEQIETLKYLPPSSPANPPRLTPNLKQVPTRTLRSPAGLRDEHDLPPPPKPEK